MNTQPATKRNSPGLSKSVERRPAATAMALGGVLMANGRSESEPRLRAEKLRQMPNTTRVRQPHGVDTNMPNASQACRSARAVSLSQIDGLGHGLSCVRHVNLLLHPLQFRI